MEALTQYIDFLWAQFQYDWSIFSNPWILYTVFPALGYLLFFFVKWYVLLIPITLPCTILTKAADDRKLNDQLDELKSKLK